MLIPLRILQLLGMTAWAIAFFTAVPAGAALHAAVAEMFGVNPLTHQIFEETRWLRQTTFAGLGAGLLLFGVLCDRFGRFRVLIWCSALTPLCAMSGGVAMGAWDFALFRFLVGLLAAGLLVASSVLLFDGLPSRDRGRALLCLPLGGVVGLLGMSVLWMFCQAALGGGWRAFLFLHVVLLPLTLLFLRYHDEPIAWKRARLARSDRRRREKTGRELFTSRQGRIAAVGAMVVLALVGGSWGLALRGPDLGRNLIRRDFLGLFQRKDGPRCDAALVAFLVRYPAALNLEETDLPALARLPEMLRLPVLDDDDLVSCLLEGVLLLHEQGRAISPTAVADRGLERRIHRLDPGRDPTDLTLSEIDEFARKTDACLALGDRLLDTILPETADAGRRTGSELWRRRSETLQYLLATTEVIAASRAAAVETQLGFLGFFFLLGGVAGLWVAWQGFHPAVSRRTAWTAFVFLFLFSILGRACFDYGRHPLESTCFCTFFLGFFLLPLAVFPIGVLPAFFPVGRRGTVLGACGCFACLASTVVFGVVPSTWADGLVPACFALGIPGAYLLGQRRVSGRARSAL